MDIVILAVNSIAALFAIAAAVIAIVVYQKSAAIQNRAINYSLLEKRLKIVAYFEHYYQLDSSSLKEKNDEKKQENWDRIDTIQGNRINWEIEAFRILFSDRAVAAYEQVETIFQKKDDLTSKLINMLLQSKAGLPSDYSDMVHDRAEFCNALLDAEREYRKNPNDTVIINRLITLSSMEYFSHEKENYFELLQAEIAAEKQLDDTLERFVRLLNEEVRGSIK